MPRWTDALCAGCVATLAWVLGSLGLASGLHAQVVFDDTFGDPGPAPTDPTGSTIFIEEDRGAVVSGSGRDHLFHSFLEFSVPSEQTAEFQTSDPIDTVVARVTGGNPSQIDGGLRVRSESGVSDPDLFLLNPRGVVFGDDTRLDLGGALYVSTAAELGFADGSVYSATDPSLPLPSSATAPTLLRFDAQGGGDVSIAGRVRSVPDGGARTAAGVTLLGRNVEARGSNLVARGATVQIAAVGEGALDVPLDLAALGARDGSTATGSIRITGASGVEPFNVTTRAPTPDQGRIVIRGGELVLENGGLLAGGDGLGDPAIDVEVAGALRISGSAGKIESISGGAFGPGDLRIRAQALVLAEAGSVDITTNGGDAGRGTLQVEVERLSMDGRFTQIRSAAGPLGGDASDIRVEAESLQLRNDARILSETRNQGGNITIEAGSVELANGALILSVSDDAGASGDVTISGGELVVSGGSAVSAASFGTGQGGDVILEMEGIELSESSGIGTGPLVVRGEDEVATGPSGDVEITADTLRIAGGSQVTATTEGAGTAGDVVIEVERKVVVEGEADDPSGIFARSGLGSGSGATGNAGRVSVTTRKLEVRDGARVGVETFGPGSAGDLVVDAGRSVLVSGGTLASTATGSGATGEVRIESGRDVHLVRGARIRADAPVPRGDSSGDPPSAGDITITAGQTLHIEDARITTDSARLESGNVTLSSGSALGIVNAEVTTNVDSTSGQGGDIRIETRALGLATAAVTANAEGANADAGDVTVVARSGIVQSPESLLQARAELGVSGRIAVRGVETDLSAELAGLAADYRGDDERLRDPCEARHSRAGSFSVEAVEDRGASPELPQPRDAGAPGRRHHCDPSPRD